MLDTLWRAGDPVDHDRMRELLEWASGNANGPVYEEGTLGADLVALGKALLEERQK